jgi:hypothetical protein
LIVLWWLARYSLIVVFLRICLLVLGIISYFAETESRDQSLWEMLLDMLWEELDGSA